MSTWNSIKKPSAVLDGLPNPTLLWGEDLLSTSTTQPTFARKTFFCMICQQDILHHDSAYQHWLVHERERIAAKKRPVKE